MNIDSNFIVFLKWLERYEKQSREITNINVLIPLFCKDVIPMLAENEIIASLRDEWKNQHDRLSQKLQKVEILSGDSVK